METEETTIATRQLIDELKAIAGELNLPHNQYQIAVDLMKVRRLDWIVNAMETITERLAGFQP